MKALRLAVYCDYSYRLADDSVYAELPFSLFVEGLAPHCERLVVLRSLGPGRRARFRTGPGRRVRRPALLPQRRAICAAVLRAIPAAIRRFWRALDDARHGLDPWAQSAQALLFAVLAMLRRRRVVLGVRQNLPELIRHRRRGKPSWSSAPRTAWSGVLRALARFVPVVVVGADLARRYRGAKSMLDIYVSLLPESDLTAGDDGHRSYDGEELVMLSVGRLDPEKNPLLLADVLARALRAIRAGGCTSAATGAAAARWPSARPGWASRDRLVLHGYVPIDDGLWDHYRTAHVLLHVSLTEGVPQVILEAFAARLPVVATAVGGVPDLVAERGLLVASRRSTGAPPRRSPG